MYLNCLERMQQSYRQRYGQNKQSQTFEVSPSKDKYEGKDKSVVHRSSDQKRQRESCSNDERG